jgi:hypothetical protein
MVSLTHCTPSDVLERKYERTAITCSLAVRAIGHVRPSALQAEVFWCRVALCVVERKSVSEMSLVQSSNFAG